MLQASNTSHFRRRCLYGSRHRDSICHPNGANPVFPGAASYETKRFFTMTNAKCDWRGDFRGTWGQVRLHRNTSVGDARVRAFQSYVPGRAKSRRWRIKSDWLGANPRSAKPTHDRHLEALTPKPGLYANPVAIRCSAYAGGTGQKAGGRATPAACRRARVDVQCDGRLANWRQRQPVERRKLTLFKRQFSVDPEYGYSPPEAHSAFRRQPASARNIIAFARALEASQCVPAPSGAWQVRLAASWRDPSPSGLRRKLH